MIRSLSLLARAVPAVVLALGLTGCATAYQAAGRTGGYTEHETSQDVWVIQFNGNGFTTRETAQTYWLYHCAEVAIAKGYQGFQVITSITLGQAGFEPSPGGVFRVKNSGGGQQTFQSYANAYAGPPIYMPSFAASVRFLKTPFTAAPQRGVFDASILQAQLTPYVTGPKCGGNVCPHVHSYLYDPALTAN